MDSQNVAIEIIYIIYIYQQSDSTFVWQGKRPRIDGIILKEKTKIGGLTLLDFKAYH